ncbi:ATP synthase mitochondrial F1 complex assembly factor 2 [Galdieria sulphuraria]|nr:ATP synthase mitochondrial F1 complex assembly factor 2 [Galdieria sulphuraria]
MICGLRVIGHIGSIVKRELSAGSLQLVRSFKAPFLLQRNRTVCTQQVGHPVQSHATCNLSLRPDNNGLGPKRFYEQVYTVERIPGVYCVSLDGKLLRTRTGKFLESRCRELSLVVASEWEAQHSRILPSSMPVTSLLTTSIDLTKEHRQQFLKTLSEFFNTDTICIRASYPEGLVFRQKVLWDPLIVFLSENWNIQIRTSEDLFRSLSEKAISTRQAMEACRCEEDFQIQYWGDVEGCHDIDRADTFVRLASASLVFSLLRTFPECFHSQN